MNKTPCGKIARPSYEDTTNVWPKSPSAVSGQETYPSLLRCPDCAYRFFDNDEVAKRWAEGTNMAGSRHDINREYSDHHVPAVSHFLSTARAHLGIPFGPFRHHDIGCAYGHLVYHLRRLGIDSTGSELDAEAIVAGQQRPEWGGFGEAFLKSGLAKDVVEEKQNLFTLVHVLEHVVDPVKVLSEAQRMLEDRGLVYVAVPNALHLPNGRYGITLADRGGIDAEHLSFFTPTSLSCVCEAAGLEIIDVWTDAETFHYRMIEEWFHAATGRSKTAIVNPSSVMDILIANLLTFQVRIFAKRKTVDQL